MSARLDSETESRIERLPQFIFAMLVLDILVLVVEALFFPPDPFTQLLIVGPGFTLAIVGAYWLVYRDGWSRIRARLGF